jgi:hypothetical protein
MAGQSGIDELAAEQLIGGQAGEQFEFFGGEFDGDERLAGRGGRGCMLADNGDGFGAGPGGGLADHFDLRGGAAREGMARRERKVQWTQARVEHTRLVAAARAMGNDPTGRGRRSTAGLKTKAIRSRATVVVCWVPVDFRPGSNTATSSVVNCG